MSTVWVVEVEHKLDRYKTRVAICGTKDRAVEEIVKVGDVCGIEVDSGVLLIANMFSCDSFTFHMIEEDLL